MKYTTPEMKIVMFEAEDVMAASAVSSEEEELPNIEMF